MTIEPDPRRLSDELEDLVYAAWFESAADRRDAAIDALAERHPDDSASIHAIVAELSRSNEILAPIAAEPLASRRIGPYLLQETLGRGGFGQVFRAYQLEPVRRVVALKVLHASWGNEARSARRFELERDALARMSHAAIAQIYDAGITPEGRPFFAMELVEGLPIIRFADRAALGIRARIELFLAVCAGVIHAHQRGFIHRDLKPSNILVRHGSSAAEMVPKIIDFGVAALVDESEPTTSGSDRSVVGTPEYMSPEQSAGDPVDTRTDVWALGALLFELLTGDLPFGRHRLRGQTLQTVAEIVQREAPRRLSVAFRAAVDAEQVASRRATQAGPLLRVLRSDLEWILRRALARHADARYGSVIDFARDLERHLRDEPVAARPTSSWYVLRKFGRRHRAAVGIAATVLLSLGIAAGGVLSGLFQATRARDEAVAARNAANMAAGFAAFELSRPREVGLRLAAVPPEARRWEWQYLESQLDESTRVMGREVNARWHDVKVCGSHVVAAASGITAVLRAADGRVLARREDTGEHPRIAPAGDGSRIAEIDQSGRVRILRLPGLEIERTVAEGHPGGGGGVAWSPEDDWIAAGDTIDSCFLYPLGSGGTWRIDGLGADVRAAFHPHDGTLACLGRSGEVHIVDLLTRQTTQRFRLLPAEGDVFPRALRIAPDGGSLACVTTAGDVHLVDWGTTEPRWSVHLGLGRLSDVAFSARGLLVVGGFSRPVTTLLGLANGETICSFNGHATGVEGVAIGSAASASEFFTASSDLTIRAWQLDQVQQPVVVPVGRGLCDVRFDAAGRLITSSQLGSLRCWDPRTGTRLGEAETGLDAPLLATNDDDAQVAAASIGHLQTFATPAMTRLTAIEHDFVPRSVAYLTVAGRIALGVERAVVLYESSSLREVGRVRVGNGPIAVAAIDGGSGFVTVDAGGSGAARFDAHGTLLMATPMPAAFELACAHRGDLAAASGIDQVVRIWDTRTGVLQGQIPTPAAWGLDWSPDDARIAAGCGDGVVRLLDPRLSMPVVAIRMALGGSGSRFSPDGRSLAGICGPTHGPASAFVWSIP